MLRKPENKIVELSIEETEDLLVSIQGIDLNCSRLTIVKECVIDIYENYEFSYSEIKNLINVIRDIGIEYQLGVDLPSIFASVTNMLNFADDNNSNNKKNTKNMRERAIIEEFTMTHDIHEGINKYVTWEEETQSIETIIQPCKVLRYSNKELNELFGVETKVSKNKKNTSKPNSFLASSITKAADDGDKEFSSALSEAIENIPALICNKLEQEEEAFADILTAYKLEYYNANPQKKDELVLEVAKYMANSLA